MITFQRILFPVDLSKQGREAAPFVKAMAQRFQAEVILLHVAEIPPSWYGTSAEGPIEQPVVDLRTLTDQRRVELDAYLADEFHGFNVRRLLDRGAPAAVIADYARDQKADLIMMPTHGYGPFRSLLLGSVTAKVLHDTACPVWTGVHTDQMWSHKGASWSRFLCAVGAEPDDVPLIRWAAQFSSEQGAQLQLVHAVHAAAPIEPGAESDTLREFLQGVARERLAKLQAEAGTNCDVWLRLGAVGQVTHEAACEHNADLILIGRGVIQKTFGRLRSEAYAIIREAPCPVISI
jgi:nucleotide-binding universal stress UspA family protein